MPAIRLSDENLVNLRKWAIETTRDGGGRFDIEDARTVVDFVLGTSDGKVIDAAREFAAKVS